MRLFYLILNCSPVFGKLKNLTFFSKNHFPVKFSQDLSTYSNHEYLQVKNTSVVISASGNPAKNFQICKEF